MITPILHLLRLHQPVGIVLLLVPCWWGVLLSGQKPDMQIMILLLVGSITMRSAGCIINDLWDADIDKQVERTKSRPLASGTLSRRAAFIMLALCLVIGAFVLYSLPKITWLITLLSIPLVVIYPLMKRFVWWPQAFLAIVFNWGVFTGWLASGAEPSWQMFVLYISAMLWTLAYDTIYACQDKADDALIGVKSSALWLGKHVNSFVSLSLGVHTLGLMVVASYEMTMLQPIVIANFVILGTFHSCYKTENYAFLFKSQGYYGLLTCIVMAFYGN